MPTAKDSWAPTFDQIFEKMMKLSMINMMQLQQSIKNNPFVNRETTNEMPIDPDGRVLSLIGEIQSSLNQLRTLILSRGRE